MAFDDRGRLYVVENRGYPGPLEGAPQPPPEGVIALLEDGDNDGRFDTRTDFAGGLTYPNGVMPWNGGVFVSSAPDLLYVKDTNGDGVADERRVVLTGFDTTRTPQIRFSHPTLGIDNWIYLTSGLNGGNVVSPAHPDRAPVKFSTSDSRFNPVVRVSTVSRSIIMGAVSPARTGIPSGTSYSSRDTCGETRTSLSRRPFRKCLPLARRRSSGRSAPTRRRRRFTRA
jgi:hypothetical protein